jgi:hypothetical protein
MKLAMAPVFTIRDDPMRVEVRLDLKRHFPDKTVLSRDIQAPK